MFQNSVVEVDPALYALTAPKVRVPVAHVDGEEAQGEEDPGDAVDLGHGVEPGGALLVAA